MSHVMFRQALSLRTKIFEILELTKMQEAFFGKLYSLLSLAGLLVVAKTDLR